MWIRNRVARIATSLIAVSACAWGVSCGSSDDGNDGNGNSGGSSATNSGGSGAISLGDGALSGGSGGGLNEDAACAADEQEAKLLPLAMYIMLDKSGSMDNGGKWTAAESAITQFVQDPNSAGMKVALGYFPDGGSCNGSGYDTPDVAMALLPGNASAIVASLAAHDPSGNTPTEGALNGLVRFCDDYEQSNPTEKCIGLLVTDGEPNGCDESTSTLTSIAAGASGGTPSTLIFTMGMDGADFNLLDQIAQSGGSTASFDASAGAAAFLAALQAIKGAALSCEMLVPQPSQGELNPDAVNVNFTKGDGTIVSLGRVDDASACVPGAWHYDNNQNPTQIILCPATCQEVQADPNGKIKVLLGCASKPPT